MSKHTQGKWATSVGEFGFDICKGQGTIGTVYGNDTDARANANLIASAPEMLEALKMVAEYCDRSLYSPKIEKLCKDLISKAEGGAK